MNITKIQTPCGVSRCTFLDAERDIIKKIKIKPRLNNLKCSINLTYKAVGMNEEEIKQSLFSEERSETANNVWGSTDRISYNKNSSTVSKKRNKKTLRLI